MAEMIFLWFGVAAILMGKDMLDRNNANGVVVMILGIAGLAYYVVSVFITLPSP